MEKQSLKGKVGLLFEKKSVRVTLVLVALSFLGAAGYFVGRPVFIELKGSSAVKQVTEKGVVRAYVDAIFSVINKLSDLEKLDRTNAELNRKLAILEKDYEAEKSKNIQEEAKEVTQHLDEKLKGEAGSELARVLQSIEYKPPSHLLPHQQYTLALGYFRKQEYEQAAVLFTYLTELKEDASYQRPEVYLMSGISWFKLKHFKLAIEYVQKTLKKSDDDTAVHRKAILWQALLSQVTGNGSEAQRILTGMVARYPHSEEVTWINQRASTTAKKVEEKHEATEHHAKGEVEQSDEQDSEHHDAEAKRDVAEEKHPKKDESHHDEEKHDEQGHHDSHE